MTIVRNEGLTYQLIICIALALLLFYFNTTWISRFQRITKKAIAYSILSLLLALFIFYLVQKLMLPDNLPPLPNQISFGILIFYFSIAMAYSLVKHSYLSGQKLQQAALEKKQAELSLLRNQLQPHFLFNALNNLLSMVNQTKHAKLAGSFERLSGLLRYVIDESKADKVAISDEITFLQNYIDLQLLRFKDGELNMVFKVEGNNHSQKIEPGLFIPFVENAFKYGTQPENQSGIELYFNIENPDKIAFRIKNKIQQRGTEGSGTGLISTQKRLALIYPNKHTFLITKNDFFLVELTITTK